MKLLARVLGAALCAVLLAGCAGAPTAPPPAARALFQDALFGAADPAINNEQIFALTPEMKQYAREIVQRQRGKGLQQALFDALYRKDQLKLDYDSALTRDAAQTFAARAGNCLSLVVMTAALAREMDLTVTYQSIPVEEAWSRSGQLYIASGHVNLVLGKPRSDVLRGYDQQQYFTIDFMPPPDGARQLAEPLEEHTIVAMFMNNRAAEALAAGRGDDAYWWVRQALERDPAFLNAYNTLGVVYQHAGHHAAAEQALRYAHRKAPDNTVYLYNLAQALRQLGRGAEAAELETRLAQLEPYPPFHFFNLGRQAMQQGDYAKARQLFGRELARSPDYHEFHFWMAVACFQLGDLDNADRHMRLAMENSTTRGDHDLYTAKLDRIKAYEARPRPRP
ncbi:MAG: tetratricopeptide repeat protein [Pseudomonadota bacterium]